MPVRRVARWGLRGAWCDGCRRWARCSSRASDAFVGGCRCWCRCDCAGVLVAIADAASGIDAVGSVAVRLAVADVGQALEVLAQVAVALAVADVGEGVDVAVL